MILHRNIFNEIDKLIESKQAIVITGMRRTGKTTVLRHYFDKIKSSNKIFLDLENIINRSYFEDVNYDKIKQNLETLWVGFDKKAYIFLDEIQFVKNAPSVVKYLYDHNDIKFYLSGSASFYLKNLFSESLAGRKFLFELFPLSFNEFLHFKGSSIKLPPITENISEAVYQTILPLYEEYITFGGFPEVVLQKNSTEKNAALGDVFSSYFQSEVVNISDFRDNTIVRKLILLLAARIGQKIDVQKISAELQISRPTVYNMLEFLQGTYFVHLVPSFGGIDTASRKQNKVYFSDTGLLNYLGKTTFGSLFENAIYLKLKRLGETGYYEKKSKEIDFVVNNSAYEVKTFASSYDIKRVEKISKKEKFDSVRLFSWRYSGINEVLYGFMNINRNGN